MFTVGIIARVGSGGKHEGQIIGDLALHGYKKAKRYLRGV